MNNKGFTLVELLIVVAIIGILAAIAVPNLLDAIDRSKQRATVAEIRIWGIALQDYNANQSSLPAVPGGGACGAVGGGEIDLALRDSLVPFSINTLQIRDKWLKQLCYDSNLIDSYTVRSCGKDGICVPCPGGCSSIGLPNAFNLDIVLNDGVFTFAPS